MLKRTVTKVRKLLRRDKAQKPLNKDFVPIGRGPNGQLTVPGPEQAPAHQAPTQQPKPAQPGKTPSKLNIVLNNDSSSATIYCYVTGQAIDDGNRVFLLEADGKTVYHPANPSAPQTKRAVNCAIPLAGPGQSKTITIPHVAGGRIWFSIGSPLTFLINPGPALVEPSVTNTSDPNYNINWGFCEFTYNDQQLFANISYVDMVSIPISMNLTSSSGGATQYVSGISPNGLNDIAAGLQAQDAMDHQGWSKLVIKGPNGQPLRALAPNAGAVLTSGLFSNGNYYASYVDQVWSKYTSSPLTIDTQTGAGKLTGRVSGNQLKFSDGSSFSKPSASDIFSCSTGPFSTGGASQTKLALIPRLAAAFNRSTLLTNSNQPDGEKVSNFYKDATTNHYSRIVHEHNVDNKGYAFPYDDVNGNDAFNSAGVVFTPTPGTFTIAVGGKNARK